MPSEEQKSPSQEGSRLNKFKILSTSVLKLGFGSFLLCVVGAVLIASSFWGYEKWGKKQQENRAHAMEGKSLNLVAPGGRGAASISLKYTKDQKVKYNLNFKLSEGFSGEAKGVIMLRFLDKDNFEVFHHSFNTLTPIVDSDRIVGYSELGEIMNVDPQDFAATIRVEAAHSLTIRKIAPPESEVSPDKNKENKILSDQVDVNSIIDIRDLRVKYNKSDFTYADSWNLEGIVKNCHSDKVVNSVKVRVVINDESNEQILSVGDTIKEISGLSIPPGQGRKIYKSLDFGEYPPRLGSKWSFKLSTVEVK